MRWWFRKKPKPPAIPTYPLPPIVVKPVPKDPDYVVEQTEMSATGIFRLFGRRPKGE